MAHTIPYKGESLKMFERIHPYRMHENNKIYFNAEGNFYYYINSKTYLHILKPEKAKFNGNIVYCIVDYRMNADNTMSESDRQFYYNIESFKAVIEEYSEKAKTNAVEIEKWKGVI